MRHFLYLMINIYFISFTATSKKITVYRKPHKIYIICMTFQLLNLEIIRLYKKVKIKKMENIKKKMSKKLLTGMFLVTSHKHKVLSVDADANSSFDRNFTYDTAFWWPIKILRG